MNIQEKAEKYAREHWGEYFEKECEIAGYDLTYGDISASDYTAGYNEAKRWIPVGERNPYCGTLCMVKVKSEYGQGFFYELADFENEIEPVFFIKDTDNELDVIEWREI